ncbi:MAG: chemotaxis protein CheB [Candidatus Competibacteraceae bacterium]|jgi:two-component system CheB/CheR fusion protein|nr:chemotaxis protein CheB [Candidatus Competibacteraceae bacterium]
MPTKKTKPPAKDPAAKASAAGRKRGTAAAQAMPRKSAPAPRSKTTPAEPAELLTKPGLFVVGVGASAGGLEAVTEMLNHLPPDIGMAFVLVQHLAPGHDSMMTELLTRETTLAVAEITDGMTVAANQVFVIPPNSNLGIINGVLHLMPRDPDAKKRHLPIDYFFQSLAKDQGQKAIGIILSGSASDGTEGLKAIHAEGGITFAQDSDTARYDSMPNNAVATGCVDFVLNPQGIAQELTQIARHPEVLRADIAAGKEDSARLRSEMEKILLLLRDRTGNDFTYYKQNTIQRRISRRMLVHKIDRVKDYVRYLDAHPPEVDALFHDILISVTGFFRNPEAFEALKVNALPAIAQNRASNQPIRIWVPGCASGEEVYSLVIVILEYLGDKGGNPTVQVFATDIDERAIAKARTGIYQESNTAHVSRERLRRFFSKIPQGYQISKPIRDMCVFAPQNVIKDPPFTHQDLIVCRNLLIYLSNALQRKVLRTFHYALNSGGYLFLGNSESVGAAADLFALADKDNKLYRKKDVVVRPRGEAVTMPIPLTPLRTAVEPLSVSDRKPEHLQRLAESIILNEYGPPGVIVNEQLNAVLFIGHTGPYLEPAPGVASLSLIKLAHPNLTVDLRVATHAAFRDKKPTRKAGARLPRNGTIEEVSIEVMPLVEREAGEPHYLVLFRKLAEYPANATDNQPDPATEQEPATAKDQRIQALDQELQATKAYMQTIIEDLEASNEELQSANEEIQSTNEELQSTNEELETTKEELQSTNEELITVNEELEHRNVELSSLNNDFVNLINSADLPLIVVNESLTVRYFSPQAHKLLNLIDSDIGRPIGDIRPNIDTGDITEQVHQVMDTLNPTATEVQGQQGHWYSMRIRPYRTADNRIAGAVIVFVDTTSFRETLARARRLATVVEDANDAVTVQDFEGRIQAWNPAAAKMYGYSEDEALHSNSSLIIPDDCQQDMQDKLATLQAGGVVKPFETWRLAKNGVKLKVWVTLSALKDDLGKPAALATTERLLPDSAEDPE